MKRIAVFGYSIMSLEVMSRLNEDQYRIVFIGKDESEADLVAEKGFDVKIIDFRNDDELKSIGIGADVDIYCCLHRARRGTNARRDTQPNRDARTDFSGGRHCYRIGGRAACDDRAV